MEITKEEEAELKSLCQEVIHLERFCGLIEVLSMLELSQEKCMGIHRSTTLMTLFFIFLHDQSHF